MNKLQAKKSIMEIINKQSDADYTLTDFKYKNVIIYGAGVTGKLVYYLFEALGITVEAFLDRAAKKEDSLFGIPVYLPTDEAMCNYCKKLPVIVSLDRFKYNIQDIIQNLESQGYSNVFYSNNIMCKSNFYHFNTMFNKDKINLKEVEVRIIKALEMLEDDESRDVFVSFLRAYATSDFDNAIISQYAKSLFDLDFKLEKGYSRYIDCGAYTGDTFNELISHCKPELYVGFEPMLSTFEILKANVNNSSEKYDNAILYPCAISDRNSYANFNGELNGGSSLNENGKQVILTVKLDDILKNISPTMIKMDVEGAEIDALKGSENIIKKYKPDLSICVYHRLSDIWNIPILIKQFVPEYKFYLRCHSIATIETILYATV